MSIFAEKINDMSEKTKDELIGVWKDAKDAFKVMAPIAAVMLAMALLFDKCEAEAQTLEVSVGYLSRVCNADDTGASIGVNVTAPFNRYFSAALDSEVAAGTTNYKTAIDNMSVIASLRTDLTELLFAEDWVTVEARTGIGWGHTFGGMRTDHNFHVYALGISVSKEFENRWSAFISPMACWRTYAEHMGFAADRSWLRLEAGVKFRIK